MAETEEYAHVTYLFNGGRERPYDGERRPLVPSQRDVPAYDHKPQMSAWQITDAFLEAFAEDRPRFSIINFAKADMVGHTGVVPAAISGVETIDGLPRAGGSGGARGGRRVRHHRRPRKRRAHPRGRRAPTLHSLNRVPLIVTARGVGLASTGILADVAPMVLALLGIEPPREMTGRSLLEPAQERPHLTR